MRRSTFAIAEKGGFISDDARRDRGIEMIVDLRRVEAGYDDARKEVAEQSRRVSRPARSARASRRRVSARMASSPVPAEGSRTRSAAVMAAAAETARPSGTGVENCWSAWLSSERRVWVGRRPAIFASIGSAAAGDAGFAEKRFAVFAEEQHRRRLAGVVGGFPIPGAGRIGGAEGRFHRGAQDAGVDAATTFEIGKEKPRGLGDGGGCSCRRWRSRTGGRGAGRIRHEGDLGRAGTGRAAGRSLSTRPAQTRPGRPLALFTARPHAPALGSSAAAVAWRSECCEGCAHSHAVRWPVRARSSSRVSARVQSTWAPAAEGRMTEVGRETGVRPLEAPAAGKTERLSAALDED